MEFVKYWRILLAYRRMIILLSVSTVVTTVLLTFVLPEKYKATAIVLVRPQEKIKVAPSNAGKELLDYPVSQSSPIDAPSKTYIEVIKSRAVVERIVRALDLDREKGRPQGLSPYQDLWWRLKETGKDAADWVVKILKYGRFMKMSPLEKATDDVKKYLDLKSTKETYIFEITYWATNRNEAAAVANAAAEIFIQYMSTANQEDSTRSRVFLEGRLDESETKLTAARVAFREFKERNAIVSFSDEYASKLKIIGNLETDLEKTEATLAGLTATYTRDHPRVASLVAERQRIIKSIAQRKRELDTFANKEKEFDSLSLQVKVAEENYKLLHKEYEEARISEANIPSEIRIVSPASPPSYPSKPIKVYYAGAALAIALLLGIGLALVLESSKARIRSVEDVAAILQLPVLATIPSVRKRLRGRP